MHTVKVMADYFVASPIWSHKSADVESRTSVSLRQRLKSWSDEYSTRLWESPSDADERKWNDRGHELARELQRELGADFAVVYFDMFLERDVDP
jgi:hypothetical protein